MNGRTREWRQTLFVGALVAGDVLSIFICFATAYWLRYRAPGIGDIGAGPGLLAYAQAVLLVSGTWVAIFAYFGLYELRRGWRVSDLLFTGFAAVTLGMVFFLALSYLLKWFFYSRLLLLYLWLVNIIAMVVVRVGMKRALMWAYRRGIGVRRMVVVGDTEAAASLVKTATLHPELGYRVVGALQQESSGDGARASADHWGLRDTLAVLAREQVRDIVLTVPVGQNEELREFITACQTAGIEVRLVPDLYELYSSSMHLDGIEGIPLLAFRRASMRGWERAAKRALDVSVAALLLVATCSLWSAVALMLRRRTGQAALERHARVGRMGRPFTLLRFAVPASAPTWLARYSVSELPQLLNVLRGEMSLVGPRPEEPERAERYSAWHRRRLLVPPGITGLAQVNGLRGFDSTDEKTRFDLQYIERQSLLFDLKLLLQTVWTLAQRGRQRVDPPPESTTHTSTAPTTALPGDPRRLPC
ncbi:MAG: sugar transferase [Deltaproteobacteria bacterium]|nr:sugar transferase [Deltaproteobacteria bacterium]MBI3390254.1 sugar transferase [Deltaproteobacteria bacterium]